APLLAAAAADPAVPWPELPLLGDAERHQLLREWNDPAPTATGSPAVATATGSPAASASPAATGSPAATRLPTPGAGRAAAALPHPPLRGLGEPPTARSGGALRRSLVDLWRAQRPGQPDGASPARPRGRAGDRGRPAAPSVARHGGGMPGGRESRRRLPAARSGRPLASARLPAFRRRRPGCG